MNLNNIKGVSDSTFEVMITEIPTIIRLKIINARLPMISAIGANAMAPTIIPANAKLKIQPRRSGVSAKSTETGDATTAMAVISNPSSILKIKQRETTRIC